MLSSWFKGRNLVLSRLELCLTKHTKPAKQGDTSLFSVFPNILKTPAWMATLPVAGDWNLMILEVPYNPSYSTVWWKNCCVSQFHQFLCSLHEGVRLIIIKGVVLQGISAWVIHIIWFELHPKWDHFQFGLENYPELQSRSFSASSWSSELTVALLLLDAAGFVVWLHSDSVVLSLSGTFRIWQSLHSTLSAGVDIRSSFQKGRPFMWLKVMCFLLSWPHASICPLLSLTFWLDPVSTALGTVWCTSEHPPGWGTQHTATEPTSHAGLEVWAVSFSLVCCKMHMQSCCPKALVCCQHKLTALFYPWKVWQAYKLPEGLWGDSLGFKCSIQKFRTRWLGIA